MLRPRNGFSSTMSKVLCLWAVLCMTAGGVLHAQSFDPEADDGPKTTFTHRYEAGLVLHTRGMAALCSAVHTVVWARSARGRWRWRA